MISSVTTIAELRREESTEDMARESENYHHVWTKL